MENLENTFSQKTPCEDCPFRKGVTNLHYSPGYREGIVAEMLSDKTKLFYCVDQVVQGVSANSEPHGCTICAGAVALTKKFGHEPEFVKTMTSLKVISPSHYDEAHRLTANPSDLDMTEISRLFKIRGSD